VRNDGHAETDVDPIEADVSVAGANVEQRTKQLETRLRSPVGALVASVESICDGGVSRRRSERPDGAATASGEIPRSGVALRVGQD
jgi:hypothetical protein